MILSYSVIVQQVRRHPSRHPQESWQITTKEKCKVVSFWISLLPKVQEKWLPKDGHIYTCKLENELALVWLCDKSEDILVDIYKSTDKLQARKSARLFQKFVIPNICHSKELRKLDARDGNICEFSLELSLS